MSANAAMNAVPLSSVLSLGDARDRLGYLLDASPGDYDQEQINELLNGDFDTYFRALSADGLFDFNNKIAIASATLAPINPKLLAQLPPAANEAEVELLADQFFPEGTPVTEIMAVLKAYEVLFYCAALNFPDASDSIQAIYARIRQAKLETFAAAGVGAVPLVEAGAEEQGFGEIGQPDEEETVPEAMDQVPDVAAEAAQARSNLGKRGRRRDAESPVEGRPPAQRLRTADTGAGVTPAAFNEPVSPQEIRRRRLPPLAPSPEPAPAPAPAPAALPVDPEASPVAAPRRAGGVVANTRSSAAERNAAARVAFRSQARAGARAAARTADVVEPANLADAAPDLGRPNLPRPGAADLPRRSLAEQITRLPPRGNNRYRNSDAFRAELVNTRDEPGCFAKSPATTYDKDMGIIRAKYRPGPKPGSAAAQRSAVRIRMMNRIRRGDTSVTVEEAVAAGLRRETAERLIAAGAQPRPVPPRGARPGRTDAQRAAEVTAISRSAAGFAAGVQVRARPGTLGSLDGDTFRLAARLVRARSTDSNTRALASVIRQQAVVDARRAARRARGADRRARSAANISSGRISRRTQGLSANASTTLNMLARRGLLDAMSA